MGKLRRTIQREVYDSLDSSVFTRDDFNVGFGDPDKDQWLVHIKFIHDEEFTFGIGGKVVALGHTVSRSPGEVQQQETTYHSFDVAVSLIPEWAKEIRSELKASKPIYKELDALRDIINDQLQQSVGDNDEFTVEEINELRRKFEELLMRVENLEKDNIITQKQLDEFKSGIAEVDEEIDYYPKKTWLKTASNKLVKVIASIGKSQEGRKILADGARKLIGLD
ncbi:MAG: hypothetical protein RPU64_04695 [Candidatus Sedimenticola sp. (ex Thyasira tokunagai)]